jgi:hypothetical protein
MKPQSSAKNTPNERKKVRKNTLAQTKFSDVVDPPTRNHYHAPPPKWMGWYLIWSLCGNYSSRESGIEGVTERENHKLVSDVE